jgi:hypothetical protein
MWIPLQMKKMSRKLSREWHRTRTYLAGCFAVMVALTLAGFFFLSFVAALIGTRDSALATPRTTQTSAITASLEFLSNPVKAGELAQMRVRLSDVQGKPFGGLVPLHSKYLHVFVTSDDFRLYGRDNPDNYPHGTDTASRGEFSMPILFPQAGTYSVAIRFRSASGQEITKLFSVAVADADGAMVSKSAARRPDERMKKIFANYEVALVLDPEIPTPCTPTRISFNIKKDGRPVTNLEPLEPVVSAQRGTALTIAAWDEHLQDFLYTQASANDIARMPTAELSFSRPGGYGIFSEFKDNGQIIPTSFFVPVTASAGCGG